MKDKFPGPLIFLVFVALAVIAYVGIYFYSMGHVGKPPF